MNDRTGAFNRSSSQGEIYSDRAPQEAMEQLRLLNRQDRRAESLMHVMQLLKDYPDDKFLYSNAAMTMTKLGEQAQENGDENAALELWNTALQYSVSGLKLDPNDRRMLTQTAKTFRQLGDYETSESFYLRAVRIDDEDKYTWTGMGDLYTRWAKKSEDVTDEEYDELMQDAINCYDKASTLDPNDNIVWRKIDELNAEGYSATQEGYDIGDPALDIINESEFVKPQDFRFPAPRRTLDMP